LYAPDQDEEVFEGGDDSLNILSELEDVDIPQIFNLSNGKEEVNQKRLLHSNSEIVNPCKANLQPTSMTNPNIQMTPERIQRAETKAASMIAEITNTYARKGKVPASQVIRKDPPQVATPNQIEIPNFSLEGELAKIKISVPLKELIRVPGQKEAAHRFINAGDSINLADENPQVYLGMGKNDMTRSFLYFFVG
jgi:hypothetical protein